MIKHHAEKKAQGTCTGISDGIGYRAPAVRKNNAGKKVFIHKPYVLLENPDSWAFAEEDPRGFLAQYERGGAILDEVQRVPSLFSYLQGVLDTHDKPGHFILIGSQNFLLMKRISQTLAGRVGIIRLLPLSMRELHSAGIPARHYEDYLSTGFFPRLYASAIEPAVFYSSYIQTYLEHDLHRVKQVRNRSAFQYFLNVRFQERTDHKQLLPCPGLRDHAQYRKRVAVTP